MTNIPASFSSILSGDSTQWEKPKALPSVDYVAVIQSIKLDEVTGKDNTVKPKFRMLMQIIDSGPDVPAEELEGVEYVGRIVNFDFWMDAGQRHKFATFVRSLGIEFNGISSTEELSKLIADITGNQVLVKVTQRIDQRDGEIYNDVKTVPVPYGS